MSDACGYTMVVVEFIAPCFTLPVATICTYYLQQQMPRVKKSTTTTGTTITTPAKKPIPKGKARAFTEKILKEIENPFECLLTIYDGLDEKHRMSMTVPSMKKDGKEHTLHFYAYHAGRGDVLDQLLFVKNDGVWDLRKGQLIALPGVQGVFLANITNEKDVESWAVFAAEEGNQAVLMECLNRMDRGQEFVDSLFPTGNNNDRLNKWRHILWLFAINHNNHAHQQRILSCIDIILNMASDVGKERAKCEVLNIFNAWQTEAHQTSKEGLQLLPLFEKYGWNVPVS